MTSLRALYISHVEAVQNVVRLHKASSDAAFEELTSVISSNGDSIEKVCFTCFYFYLVLCASFMLFNTNIGL